MYDAVVAVNGTKTPYTGVAYAGPATTAARDAAVAAAAQCVMQALWPEYEDYLTAHATSQPMLAGAGLDDGHRVGVEIAEMLLKLREGDGADSQMHYASSSAYGRHRVDPVNPTQPFLGPQWGDVDHFVLPAGHLQLDPPPGYTLPDYLTDPDYKADHDEVRNLGELADDSSRTSEQTLIGVFWAYDGVAKLGTPPRFYNQILRILADEVGNTPEANAELFALANVAMGDAAIEAWHWKYHYNLWRPVIGIARRAQATGHPASAERPSARTATRSGCRWEHRTRTRPASPTSRPRSRPTPAATPPSGPRCSRSSGGSTAAPRSPWLTCSQSRLLRRQDPSRA